LTHHDAVNTEAEKAAIVDVRTARAEALAIKARKDAEAYGKRAVLMADGALDKKLAAYVSTQKAWAVAYSTRKVPQMVFGGEGSGGDTDAKQFQSMLNALIAKDLMVSTNPKK
jgi:hypothetical protein